MNTQAQELADAILKTPVLRGAAAESAFNNLSGFLVGYVTNNKSIGETQQLAILEVVLSHYQNNG